MRSVDRRRSKGDAQESSHWGVRLVRSKSVDDRRGEDNLESTAAFGTASIEEDGVVTVGRRVVVVCRVVDGCWTRSSL